MARYIVLYRISQYIRHITSYTYHDNPLSNESISHTTVLMCVVDNRLCKALSASATKRVSGRE